MGAKLKNMLWPPFAIVIVVVAAVWFFSDGLEHIEDTNGPDNYSLTTITDQNIVEMDIGSMGMTASKDILSGDSIEFSSDKFTGVYEIMHNNYIAPSDIMFSLTNFNVNGGNFKVAVVLNDEVVDTLEPGMFVDYLLEDVTGHFALRIAGESADFSFYMSGFDYSNFAHP